MTGETNDRTCRACGVTGNAEAFYVCNYGKQGQPLLETICKRCKRKRSAERKRKFSGDYRSLEQIRATAKGRRAVRPSRRGCYRRYGEWAKAIEAAVARCNGKQKDEKYGEWTNRVRSAVKSMSIRRRVEPTRRPLPQGWDTWQEAVSGQMARLGKQKDTKYGEWTNKIRSTVHNWRLKARCRAVTIGRTLDDTGATGLQMCFDWMRVDAEERDD